MKVTKIVLHADAALVVDYQKYSTGMSVEIEVDPKDDLKKISLTHFPGLRQMVLDEAKLGITRAQKIKRIAEKTK
jgi:hypothetical protein